MIPLRVERGGLGGNRYGVRTPGGGSRRYQHVMELISQKSCWEIFWGRGAASMKVGTTILRLITTSRRHGDPEEARQGPLG